MKKRLLALLLALCTACAALALPAAAGGANTAVQAAVMLGGLDAGQDPDAALTRGQLAQLLVAFSPYRGGTAPAVQTAASQGWMSGYSDGSFRPEQAVTLEEACSAVLKLLGYDVTALSGGFPDAQLNKARALGLRDGLAAKQGDALTIAEGAQLLYNALAAAAAGGEVYGQSLGFSVTEGKVDVSSVLLEAVEGPFVADGDTQLPFEPAAVYRNDEAAAAASLEAYDVYYYNVSARTLWVYDEKAAGRITAVAPSAAAPASVTVAGVEYAVGTSEAAAALSSLNGGGVGQVVTLLLGMDGEVVRVLTGDAAEQVFYGVVQASARSLTETNGADVLQQVTVACTDGVTRSVNVDKALSLPAGWLVQITVDENGESVRTLEEKRLSGTVSADGARLGDMALAANVEILDTTGEGMAGTVRPSRLAGAALTGDDVRYYTTNEAGEIDRLILGDVTGDLWTYGVLDDVRNLTDAAADAIDGGGGAADAGSGDASLSALADSVLPSTSDILYGIIDGSILSTFWESLTGSPSAIASWALRAAAGNTSGALSSVLGWLGEGASYVCLIDGENATLNTAVKYPVVAGGVAVGKNAAGEVTAMRQLAPVLLDGLGAASATAGGARYETAGDMQVYLWYRGQYFATTLAQVNAEDYYLIGWRDAMGCAAGGLLRVLVAVPKG